MRMGLARWFEFLILALTALVAGCAAPGPIDRALGRDLRITADFESMSGMFQGNSVTVLGLPVGRVTRIVPRGSYVQVTMSLNGSVQYPKTAKAVLVSPSVVTDRHIELTPVYTGGPTLSDGDHLGLDQTEVPVEIETVLATIDNFANALKPQPGQEGLGPLSGRVLYPLLDGQGAKIRDTLNALSSAIKLGLDNRDAISTIIVKLNDLTTMLAQNDQTVRDFSNKTTQLTSLLAAQAPGLQATLDQLNGFLTNTTTLLGTHSAQLTDTLNRLNTVTQQLRQNARGVTEVVDVAPMLMQNINRSMNRNLGYIRLHAVLGTGLNGEAISVFCERIQMRSDGCRTGRPEDFGPDFGLTAAMLGMTR